MEYHLSYQEREGIKSLTSPRLLAEQNILVAFSNRLGGISPKPFNSLNLSFAVGDDSANVRENRKRLAKSLGINLSKLTTAEQVHGNTLAVVHQDFVGSGARSQRTAISSTDALLTYLEGVPLALFFADCLPVVLVDIERRVVGVVHTGWKGTELEITLAAVQALQEIFDSAPEDIFAFLSPSIGPCCYEVDLPALNKNQLMTAGVLPENIYSSNICTCCNTSLYFSYRAAKGKTGRQTGLVAIL